MDGFKNLENEGKNIEQHIILSKVSRIPSIFIFYHKSSILKKQAIVWVFQQAFYQSPLELYHVVAFVVQHLQEYGSSHVLRI